MNKTIAVLLPVYKGDQVDYVGKSIQSILAQTYKDYIILIGVDGPVSEELRKILLSLSDDRINILWFKENRGLAKVLNDLIKYAVTKGASFYARMDADDISLPNRFEKQLKFLKENPDVDVVGGAIQEIDENSEITGKEVHYPLTNIECRKFFRYRDPLAHPTVMFRKSFFEKAKGYRPEYRKNQDTMLWYDGFRNGCVFSNLDEVILKFRVTSDFYGRRTGWKRAKQMFNDRFKINRDLNYDFTAYVFAFAMLMMTVSPKIVKRLLYKIR